ncbi:hypothetical protein BST43_19405 [Mycobacteroides saopaulense]|uniref:Uncharacterized protein n=1 Tax=Mycobacteroides saopaulense TaxID=1578165 RepID=A0A1X0IV94_9MYCO|nr:hypothetical protein BST43_19405 [Mycobacteroides saopaulense]
MGPPYGCAVTGLEGPAAFGTQDEAMVSSGVNTRNKAITAHSASHVTVYQLFVLIQLLTRVQGALEQTSQ